jgi:RNA polymerase sigma factor (TIGR02999 family)
MGHKLPKSIDEPAGEEDKDAPRRLDDLFPVVYEELRRVAHAQLRAEARGHTLSTTALVHEAYLKLAAQRSHEFENRGHFFALAAQAMRRILVDYARRYRAAKRLPKGASVRVSGLDSLGVPQPDTSERADFLIALDDAITELRTIDERLARVVEFRFFVGLTESETAGTLGITPRTVTRDWVRARAWLYQRLRDLYSSPGPESPTV